MFFPTPRQTRREAFVMTRTEIPNNEHFSRDEVLVMVEWADRPNEAPSWMIVSEAIESPMLQIVVLDSEKAFNEKLAAIVAECGWRGVVGHLRPVAIEVVEIPARTTTYADRSLLEVEARRHPEYNERS